MQLKNLYLHLYVLSLFQVVPRRAPSLLLGQEKPTHGSLDQAVSECGPQPLSILGWGQT